MSKEITDENLCAVVVWYNPNEEIAKNILRYNTGVHKVFVIDNSDKNNQSLLDGLKIENVCYHFIGENKGIAVALNIGFEYARKCHAEWVLTMDQDSIFEGANFENYKKEIINYIDKNEVAIFSIKHDFGNLAEKTVTNLDRYCEKKRVMCSGNVVSYRAYHQVGGYRDDFFVDWVDFEFCARIKMANYRIIECTQVILKHFLGERIIETTFFGAKKYIPDYPLWRKYYLARNVCITAKIHKSMRYSMYWRLFQEFKQILLYEHSEKKWGKIRTMFIAICNAGKPVNFIDIKKKYC
ncbi:MAG: glycosyltransferase [Dysgonamonadaceae bacterium]|jgi:rhamnosyltransferase|nr:glycosyltransferase [Dysgonamonadaceae bacterium]